MSNLNYLFFNINKYCFKYLKLCVVNCALPLLSPCTNHLKFSLVQVPLLFSPPPAGGRARSGARQYTRALSRVHMHKINNSTHLIIIGKNQYLINYK